MFRFEDVGCCLNVDELSKQILPQYISYVTEAGYSKWTVPGSIALQAQEFVLQV
jgi:hypothetical protein